MYWKTSNSLWLLQSRDFLSSVNGKNLTLTTDRGQLKVFSGRLLQKKSCPWKLENPESIQTTTESEVKQKKKEKSQTTFLWKSSGTDVSQRQAYSALRTHRLNLRTSRYEHKFVDTVTLVTVTEGVHTFTTRIELQFVSSKLSWIS